MCDDCGQTPRYIVVDGKMTAPTLRKEQHLDEFAPEEKDDQEPMEESSSPVAGLRFLVGMEVLVKESSLVPQLLGEAGFVMGMHQGWVKVLMPGQGQFLLSPRQLEHLPPEVGDKAKYCMEGQGDYSSV